jgi:MFS family permease
MESLDTTILNTAVPTIAHALKVPPLSMKAVLAGYILSLAVFIPISGWMASHGGHGAPLLLLYFVSAELVAHGGQELVDERIRIP